MCMANAASMVRAYIDDLHDILREAGAEIGVELLVRMIDGRDVFRRLLGRSRGGFFACILGRMMLAIPL